MVVVLIDLLLGWIWILGSALLLIAWFRVVVGACGDVVCWVVLIAVLGFGSRLWCFAGDLCCDCFLLIVLVVLLPLGFYGLPRMLVLVGMFVVLALKMLLRMICVQMLIFWCRFGLWLLVIWFVCVFVGIALWLLVCLLLLFD